MTKLDDEQLSKVLTAHSNGNLVKYGAANRPAYPGCIVQVAFELPVAPATDRLVSWFDVNYDNCWTEEEFMEKLEQEGFI